MLLEEKATLVNTINLSSYDPESDLSIVLYLTDQEMGHEASFTISSSNDATNSKIGEIISACIVKKNKIVRERASSPHFSWLRTPQTLLRSCWNIEPLRDTLLKTNHFVKQSNHYFVSEFIPIPKGLILWSEFTRMIWEAFYYQTITGKVTTKIVGYPSDDDHFDLDQFHLIRYLIRNKRQKTSFKLKHPPTPRRKGGRTLRVDLWYDKLQNGSEVYKVRFIVKSGAAKWAAQTFRRVIENIYLELDQFKTREIMSLAGDMEKVLSAPFTQPPSRHTAKLPMSVRMADLFELFKKAVGKGGKRIKVYYHLITLGQKEFFFREDEIGKLKAIFFRQGAKFLYGLKVWSSGPSVRTEVKSDAKGRFSIKTTSSLAFSQQNVKVINRLKGDVLILRAKTSDYRRSPTSKYKEIATSLVKDRHSQLSDLQFRIKTIHFRDKVTPKGIRELVANVSKLINTKKGASIILRMKNGNAKIFEPQETETFYDHFKSLEDIVSITIEKKGNDQAFFILSIYFNLPKEIVFIYNLEIRVYRKVLDYIHKSLFSYKAVTEKPKTTSKINRSRGKFYYPVQFPKERWVGFLEELEAILPSKSGYQFKITSVYGNVIALDNREVERIVAKIQHVPQQEIKFHTRGMGNKELVSIMIDIGAAKSKSKSPNGKYTVAMRDNKKLSKVEALILGYLSITPPHIFSNNYRSPKVKTRLVHNFTFNGRLNSNKFCKAIEKVGKNISTHKTMQVYIRYKKSNFYYHMYYANQTPFITKILMRDKAKISRIEVKSPAIFKWDVGIDIGIEYTLESYEHLVEIVLTSFDAAKNIKVRNELVSLFP